MDAWRVVLILELLKKKKFFNWVDLSKIIKLLELTLVVAVKAKDEWCQDTRAGI